MEQTNDAYTERDRTISASGFSPSETSPTCGRVVSFHMASTGSTTIRVHTWPGDLPPGNDTLTYPQGSLSSQLGSVTGLHASIIEARSPLIAAAFESSGSGKRLHLESLDSSTVSPFVRFLYTGSYANIGDWEDVPTSVLQHCKMYYLGHLYDLADLKSQAYVNVLRQCEFGCSSPNMPIDLCPAIEFVYQNLSGHDAISDALVQYCVTRCMNHKLHEDADFRDLAFFVRAFHQDLTKACRDRCYEDESAAIIIQLPYMHYAPDTFASTENPPISGFEDIIHHFHSFDRFDENSSKKRPRVTPDERQASPTKVLKLHEAAEQPVNRLALRPARENLAPGTLDKQSTSEPEAKLPEVHGLPNVSLHPAFEALSHATMSQQKARESKMKLPMRPLVPSSTDVPKVDVLSKDENLPIWRRRNMTGTDLGLSQAFETPRSQEKQPNGDQSFEAAASSSSSSSSSREYCDRFMNQSKEKNKQQSPTGQDLQWMRSASTPRDGTPRDYEMRLRQYEKQKMERISVSNLSKDDALVSPQAPQVALPLASIAPRAPATAISKSVGPNTGNHALQDYQMQLMLLEQQNKKRLLMARQEQDAMNTPCGSTVNTSANVQPANLNGRSEAKTKTAPTPCHKVLSAQAPPRDIRARKVSASTTERGAFEAVVEPDNVTRTFASSQPSVLPPIEFHAMQRMLLEQQNKKRLLMARLEREPFLPKTYFSTANAGSSSANDSACGASRPQANEARSLESYQSQLMLLEQLNKKNQPKSSPVGSPSENDPSPMHIDFVELAAPGGDVLDNFDFDAFLSTSPTELNWINKKSAAELNTRHSETQTDNSRDESPAPAAEHIEYRQTTTPISDSRSADNATDAFESDSDSDAQSWVDVSMEPPSGIAVTPVATNAVTRPSSTPVPTSFERSPSLSDSEWDFC